MLDWMAKCHLSIHHRPIGQMIDIAAIILAKHAFHVAMMHIGDQLSTSPNTCKGLIGNLYNSSSVSSETINGGMLSSHASAAIQSHNQVIAVHGQNGY